MIHGTHDSLAYVEDTRHFVAALRKVSRQPVVYAELPGAQHAFDIFHSTRSAYAVEAVTRFVEGVRAAHLAARTDTRARPGGAHRPRKRRMSCARRPRPRTPSPMKLAPTFATMKWRQPASTSGATSAQISSTLPM